MDEFDQRFNETFCRCWSLLPALKVLSFLATLFYLGLSIFIGYRSFDEPGEIAFALLAFFFAVMAFLYYKGISNENDWIMIPFLVAEILARVVTGFMLCFTWGIFVLSIFDMFLMRSPIPGFTCPQFLALAAIVFSIAFAVYLECLFPIYNGYTLVKRRNDHRQLINEESAYMKISFTSRPTTV
uniref:MARVEL domain-containing protein n=1 Tax=Panagrellus redivivus TaxID=6233 RepID=A0A7E4VVP9_PANRE